MSLTAKLLSASGGGTDKLYVDDTFSTHLYTGNGGTQTINNGIDLAGKGGMVWTKARSAAQGHWLHDTVMGVNTPLASTSTAAQSNLVPYGVTSFNSNGFSVNDQGVFEINANGIDYASWTFRKSPKFFDGVTYTGNGASSRAIAHSLGQEVGMVMTKATSTTGDWNTYHRSATGDLVLNTTAAQTGSKALVNSATTSTFTVSEAANTNAVTYVAYLFAHDPSADGFIQCGSFTTDASGNATVNLGWEPQYILFKSTATAGDWMTSDAMRGMSLTGAQTLSPNVSGAETSQSTYYWTKPNATGFNINAGVFGQTCIYLAIRRPNKPPTTGTQVYGSVAANGESTYDILLPSLSCLDLIISQKNKQSGGSYNAAIWNDRLRGFPGNMSGSSYEGNPGLNSASTASEGTGSAPDSSNYLSGVSMNRAVYGGGWNGYAGVFHAFRRAPGFFDIVCYTGTGVARTVPHSLGVAPELMIVKARNTSSTWMVYTKFTSPKVMMLQATNAVFTDDGGSFNLSDPDAAAFQVGGYGNTNQGGYTYIAYLFATLPGISKVGSYTGNGSSQTINCGFTTGARFILIKCTDSTGDWYVWDTARGIVAANDPHLSLNTPAAEVTSNDSTDPNTSGFIVNQVAATDINVSGASYIFLAIA